MKDKIGKLFITDRGTTYFVLYVGDYYINVIILYCPDGRYSTGQHAKNILQNRRFDRQV